MSPTPSHKPKTSLVILKDISNNALAYLQAQDQLNLWQTEKNPSHYYLTGSEMIALLQTHSNEMKAQKEEQTHLLESQNRLIESQKVELSVFHSLKLTSFIFNNVKERIILLRLAQLNRIVSFKAICRDLFAHPDYRKYFQSSNNASVSYNLRKLIKFGYISNIDTGIYSISYKGKILADMLKEVI
jgi:hypothetical protein